MQRLQRHQILEMAQLAVLTAIMIIMAFTPLGFLKLGPLPEITILALPVAIGASITGPIGGAFLGLVFGILSLIQCLIGSPLSFMLEINAVATVLLCIIPRVLCGFLPGLIFKGLRKIDKTKIILYFVTALLASVFNTIFFVGGIYLVFGRNADFLATMESYAISTNSIIVFIAGFAAINGVIEAVVNCILGGAIGKAIDKFINKR